MRRVRQNHLRRFSGVNDGQMYKVPSETHPAKSRRGSLSCNDPVSLQWYILSSHSLKQWGQLGEILGGVRFPMGAARRRFVQPPDSPGSSVE